MYDINYLKSQRRKLRKDIKRYLVAFRDDVVADYGIELPTEDEINLMNKKDFDKFIVDNYSKFLSKQENDLVFIEILESYMCFTNNIENLEYAKTIML